LEDRYEALDTGGKANEMNVGSIGRCIECAYKEIALPNSKKGFNLFNKLKRMRLNY